MTRDEALTLRSGDKVRTSSGKTLTTSAMYKSGGNSICVEEQGGKVWVACGGFDYEASDLTFVERPEPKRVPA